MVVATLKFTIVSCTLPSLFLLILTNMEGSLLFTGGTSTGNYGETTKRSGNRTVPLDPVREAAIARAQKKVRGDVQSTSGRRTVENDTTTANGEWACNVCTLHNPVSLSCPQQLAFCLLICLIMLSHHTVPLDLSHLFATSLMTHCNCTFHVYPQNVSCFVHI